MSLQPRAERDSRKDRQASVVCLDAVLTCLLGVTFAQ